MVFSKSSALAKQGFWAKLKVSKIHFLLLFLCELSGIDFLDFTGFGFGLGSTDKVLDVFFFLLLLSCWPWVPQFEGGDVGCPFF